MTPPRTTTPTNMIEVPYSPIQNSTLATEQLRRAWCLMLVKSLWPTISSSGAHSIAEWLHSGQKATT